MNSRHSKLTINTRKCYPVVADTDLGKFSNTEVQFLKWVQQWERKIFMGNRTILRMNGKYFYSSNVDQMRCMEAYIKDYQENNSNVIGQDRFVWTVFANALINKHKNHIHINNSCSTKLCLFLLLWSSYHLKFAKSNQVQDLLREICICTRNFKFMFTFLPGMSITSYISNFLSEKCNESVLCDEFFTSIGEDFTSSQCNLSLYQCYSPLILYFVEHLTPLHSQDFRISGKDSMKVKEKNCHFTLVSMLDKAIVDQKKHTLLTLAVGQRDDALVRLLLQIGASANTKRWDPIIEDYTSAEELLIASINSLVASKYFFDSLKGGMHPKISSIMYKIDSVAEYGNMMRRSLLWPSFRKADHMWRGESWRQELNSEIADKWGIDHKRSFPSLKHITKITIRQHILMVDRKILPDAVVELPLPNMLKSYLNLILD